MFFSLLSRAVRSDRRKRAGAPAVARGAGGTRLTLSVDLLEDRVVPTATALLVEDLNLVPISSSPSAGVSVNGTLFFTADDGVRGRELWKSDGTAAGT
ncbi:MAG TPA: hypothetical protein VD866_24345, partial [Urbifossiella sp.]|nr:hypothetical protein [Urbifossiella sp.]